MRVSNDIFHLFEAVIFLFRQSSVTTVLKSTPHHKHEQFVKLSLLYERVRPKSLKRHIEWVPHIGFCHTYECMPLTFYLEFQSLHIAVELPSVSIRRTFISPGHGTPGPRDTIYRGVLGRARACNFD